MPLFKRRPLPPVQRLMAAAGLPTAGGAIPVPDVVMEVLRREGGRIAPALAAAEDLLGGDEVAQREALRFVEGLQNAASHGSADLLSTDELLPLRGPRTIAAWAAIERFWAAVVAWCDEQGHELDSSESLRVVQNPRLRGIVWPGCRSLPDGRLVLLAEVLRYELATGESMAWVR
nr:hypothetical protein GCM10020063_025600 [Dactylosporangium thailandense]